MPQSYSDFDLRRASTEDAKACSKIVNDWIDATEWLPRHHSRDAIEDMIRSGIPLREFWVAGKPIQGYLSFNVEESQVMGLYTALRGTGVGKALMDRVREGRDWVQLWSHAANTKAHAFYEREGFAIVGERAAGIDGIPEIRMEWRRSSLASTLARKGF